MNKICAMVAACALLTGCQVHRGYDLAKAQQLQVGVTTQEDAIALLGKPVHSFTMGGPHPTSLLTFAAVDTDHALTGSALAYGMLTRRTAVPTTTHMMTLSFNPQTRLLTNISSSETNGVTEHSY